jgi:hypothetical protein
VRAYIVYRYVLPKSDAIPNNFQFQFSVKENNNSFPIRIANTGEIGSRYCQLTFGFSINTTGQKRLQMSKNFSLPSFCKLYRVKSPQKPKHKDKAMRSIILVVGGTETNARIK